MYRLGIDIGSTTLKCVLLNDVQTIVFQYYLRHNADIKSALAKVVDRLRADVREQFSADATLRLTLTGSVGMGVAERLHLPFVQEVVAAVNTVQSLYPAVRTFVDIGGEDSKMIFFEQGKTPDIRMNGSCAGGTGAFLDQTATLLGVKSEELNDLAKQAQTTYPIASRCGVFSKTDIQNLIARKVSKADIAASVMRAVALQVVGSLARGMDICAPIFFCGGPFAYMPVLRKYFLDVLNMREEECLTTDFPQYIPALGCALAEGGKTMRLSDLERCVQQLDAPAEKLVARLPQLFANEQEHALWASEKSVSLRARTGGAVRIDEKAIYYLGVDSGSTTTKIVLLDAQGEIVYTDYQRNRGDSFHTFTQAMQRMNDALGSNIQVVSAVTGYGESLLKTAFSLDYGIVETMAHFIAARKVLPQVSFILDIGGQDMKAIWVRNGSVSRMEINEACSSGCGSFLETFANQLGYEIGDFARMSCYAKHPYDLGTRCTVFMNSRVKQAMREGAAVEDIAAGFAYSVCKNCLYKVLKLHDTSELGDNILVQGGTMRNHAVVRALEQLTGASVHFTDIPELMGAYGAALYAKEKKNS